MTREEREQLIERLQCENAISLEEIARRDARTAQGLDPPEWVVPEPQSELVRKKHDGGLIYKERQDALVSAAPDLTDWHQWAAVIVKTLDDLTDHQGVIADELGEELGSILGRNLRKQNDVLSKLETRINALENIVDDLAKRVEGNGYQG